MFEYLDISPDINVLESEYKRLLGYPPDFAVSDRVNELMNETRQWYVHNGAPWVYVRQMQSFRMDTEHFLIDGASFRSKRILDQMRETDGEGVVAVVVSAGKNCEGRARQLWKEEKPDEYFFMEVFGSAIVEHLIAAAAGKICAWAERNSMVALPRYSPGYPEWDIQEQQALFDVIERGKKHAFPEEIHVMQTGMLNPKKSLLTIFGLTKHREKVRQTADLIPCFNCSLEHCQYRRGTYRRTVAQIEDVGTLQTNEKRKRITMLALNAKYTFGRKALEKWSKERLQLQFNKDQSVHAAFRYQGTTCSNMGHVLEFDYRMKIGPPHTAYTILEAECMPAPEEDGYTYMCQYIEHPDSLMKALSGEMPLVGKSLNEVLKWEREYNPSACYCQPSSRDHKWGLVLEVLHYAIVQHEKEKIPPPSA